MTTLYCPICAHSNSTLAHSCASCSHPLPASRTKKKWVTLVLWAFLGNFGAHRIYLNDLPVGMSMLLLVFGSTVLVAMGVEFFAIFAIIGLLWVFCDGVYLAFKGKDFYRNKANG